jgi:predicted ester cyclase
VTGERLHLADDSAVAETTWRGTHVGTFAGVAATHRAVEFTVAVVIEFRDGLMASERFDWDAAGLAKQIGVATLGFVDRAMVSAGGRST